MRLRRDILRLRSGQALSEVNRRFTFVHLRWSIHCIDYRRSAGAPYVQWGSVPREDVVITKGEPHKIPHANRIRSFAACCGTHLFFEDTKDSDMIDVTIASLDDPTPFTPQKAIFLEDKLPWVVIDESIPSFQTSPEEGLTTNGHE